MTALKQSYFVFFTTGLLCHSVVIPTFSFVASRNAKHSLVTDDTNNKLYSANQDMLSNPRILQLKQDRLSFHGSCNANHDCCSVHGSSDANQATLFNPRIFRCKSRHAVQFTDLPTQIKPYCSIHGSSDANRDTLFISRIFQCKSGQAVQSTDFKMYVFQ